MNPEDQGKPIPEVPQNRFPRLPGETVEAYEGFLCYFEMPPKRSLAKVAEELGVAEQTVKDWSSKFCWRKRMDDYLQDLSNTKAEIQHAAAKEESLARAELQALKLQMKIELAKLMYHTGPKMLNHLLRTNPNSIRLHEITPFMMRSVDLMDEAAEDSRPADKGRRTSSQYDADLRQVYGIKKEIPPSEQPPSAGAETPPSASPEPPPDEQKS